MTRTSRAVVGRRPGVVAMELRGPDVRRFANGQFTNKSVGLELGAHQHSALTDDRGRIQALLDVVPRAEDRLFVALEGMSVEAFAEELKMVMYLEDIEAVPIEGEIWTVQEAGELERPEGSWNAPRSAGGGFDVLGPPDVGADPIDKEGLEALRIAAGWPRWPVDGATKQLPHELGLRETHLHFEKGCYRGQEIIHRVDVMGQVRKGLVGVRLDGPVAPGSDVRVGPKKVGRLGSVATHPALGPIALAVVRNEHGTPGTALEIDGVAGEVRALPMGSG